MGEPGTVTTAGERAPAPAGAVSPDDVEVLGAAPSRAWLVARILLLASLLPLVLAAWSAFRPVDNPGVQDCGGPLPFLVLDRDNRVIHYGDTGLPEESAHAAQPTCRTRALDGAGEAGRFFAGFLLLAGLGAVVGLIDDRVAYRRAPRYETLLRPLPLEARARHGLVPRVTPEDLDAGLPPVEGPEIAGIVVWSVVAIVGLPLAGTWDATVAAAGEAHLLVLLGAALVMVATWAAAALLRLGLPADPRPAPPGRDPVAEAGLLAVAGNWLAAVRPLMGALGLDLHVRRRQGLPRARAVADVRVIATLALAAHVLLLAPVALAVARDRHPPAVIKEPQLVLIGVVVVAVALGALRLRTAWRALPVRPSPRAVGGFLRLAPDATDRLRAAGLTLAQPLLRALLLAACLTAFGPLPPVMVVLFVALLEPVALAVSPTPGGAGTVEAVTMLLLMLVGGVEPGRAACAALAFRALSYWLPMLPGLAANRRLHQTGVL